MNKKEKIKSHILRISSPHFSLSGRNIPNTRACLRTTFSIGEAVEWQLGLRKMHPWFREIKTNYKEILALSPQSPLFILILVCCGCNEILWNTYLRIILKKVRFIHIWAGAVHTVFNRNDFCNDHFGNTLFKSSSGYKSCADTKGPSNAQSPTSCCLSQALPGSVAKMSDIEDQTSAHCDFVERPLSSVCDC